MLNFVTEIRTCNKKYANHTHIYLLLLLVPTKCRIIIHVTNDDIIDTRVFFQLNNQFIVTPIKSGMMIINQQTAHERILFEKYLEALERNPIVSQQLLFPKVITVNATDEAILLEILPEMAALGFTINAFGKSTFVIY